MATLTSVGGQRRDVRPTSGAAQVALVGAVLLALAVGALFFVGFNAVQLIRANADDTPGQIFLEYLYTYGLVLPIFLIGLGLWFARVGVNVLRRDIGSAAWAQTILLWTTIAALGLAVYNYSAVLGAPGGPARFFTQLGAPSVLLPVIIGLITGATYAVLNPVAGSAAVFAGSEGLTSRDTRTAWSLLIPTVAVLLFVAARPLEQTFIASLTNQEFATGQTRADVQFIGAENYLQLLSVRLDTIPCEQDAAGACVTEVNEATGATEVVYPNPRRYLIDTVPSYRPADFRPLNEWRVFGQYYVLSARETAFIESIGNTLYFTVFSVSIELVLGLFIALVVNSNFPGRGAMRAAMLVPWAIPTVVSARLWEIMLRDNSSGVINQILLTAGLIDRPLAWLANESLQLPALIMVDVWKTTPFMALLLLAGLQTISSDIYEAADVDGAGPVRQFFSLTLPLLRPAIAVALVFRTLDAVRAFDVFQVLLGTQKRSMAVFNYEQLVQSQLLGYSSAVGVVIFVIILIFTFTYIRLLGVEND